MPLAPRIPESHTLANVSLMYFSRQTEDQRANETNKFATESERRMSELQAQVDTSKEEIAKVQAEVDRLLEILRQMEDEKFTKDTQIKELQE